jgi:hypothetical protein
VQGDLHRRKIIRVFQPRIDLIALMKKSRDFS